MIYLNDDIDPEEEELEDDDTVSLADDILDEVEGEDDELTPDMEGFGLLEDEPEAEDEEDEEDLDGEESLEEDAEDVDYDSFDDIDEM